MIPKFHIGDKVWRATFDASENYVTCPDCGGTGRIRVIMHDDTEVSIGCQACTYGFHQPSGKIKAYDRQARAVPGKITGVDIAINKIEYRIDGGWICTTDNVFASEEEALIRAAELAAEFDDAERKRIGLKEKDTRSWAWNASYHRRRIKEARRQIEYHTSKLNVAALKAKERTDA